MSFLEPYKKFIVKGISVHEDFAELLSLTALSTVIGKSVKLETQYAPLQLNLFTLFVGPSGLARKTIALRFYFGELLRDVEHVVEGNVSFRIPPTYTTEAIKKYFTEVITQEGVLSRDSGCIIKDEFTSLFKQTYHKKYMSDQLEFLSQMYDGYLPARQTIKHGLQPENYVFVSMVACTTPYLFTVMRPEFFMQGTGNRFLYVLSDVSSLELIQPEDPRTFFFTSEITKHGSREGKLGSFAEMLKVYRENTRELMVFVDEKASKRLTDFKFLHDTKAKELYIEDRLNRYYSYITRLPEFAFKIATLKCIDRNCYGSVKGDVEVNVKDANWACDVVRNCFTHFNSLMTLWEEIGRKERVKYRTRYVEDLKAWLSEQPERRATRTRIERYFGITALQLNEYVHLLLKNDEIEVVEEDAPHKTGKKAMYIVLKEPQPKWIKKRGNEEEQLGLTLFLSGCDLCNFYT